jgi:predicted Zn-dependent protease
MKKLHLFASLLALTLASGAMKAESSPNKVPDGFVDVWLIPMEKVPTDHVTYVGEKLAKETGLTVRAATAAGKSPTLYDPASKQLISERLLEAYKTLPKSLDAISLKTIYIILTADDLNTEDRKFRFVFMSTAPALRMAVVSMARMQDSFYGAPNTPFRTKARMYKMVKRTVGMLYYGYDRSIDKKSVMYSPIMSLNDLDFMGTDFK